MKVKNDVLKEQLPKFQAEFEGKIITDKKTKEKHEILNVGFQSIKGDKNNSVIICITKALDENCEISINSAGLEYVKHYFDIDK